LPELRTGRAEAPNNIKKIIDEIGCETIIVRNVSGAIKEAFSIASKDDLICATGSLYLASEIKQKFSKTGSYDKNQ